jgi:two-component system nitrate/nitrite response regulator NarL
MTASPRRTSVLLADDHPIFLEGIARVLGERPDILVVGSAADGTEALAALRADPPDVALLDLRLPGLSGLEVLRAVRRDDLPTRVILLTGETSAEAVLDAVAEGAAGYLTKSAHRTAIADAVVAVGRGGTALGGFAQEALIADVRGRGTGDGQRSLLSPREREVLRLMAEGLSGPAVAEALQIGTATVKTHTRNLYEKLGVSDRAAAVAEAMRRGLLE